MIEPFEFHLSHRANQDLSLRQGNGTIGGTTIVGMFTLANICKHHIEHIKLKTREDFNRDHICCLGMLVSLDVVGCRVPNIVNVHINTDLIQQTIIR